jgi:hypothetical protein
VTGEVKGSELVIYLAEQQGRARMLETMEIQN